MFARPGFHTSEFVVTVLTLLGCIVSAALDYVSTGGAFRGSVAAALAFIISRGLAKYEARGTGAQPPLP